jgi:hypothetical protein
VPRSRTPSAGLSSNGVLPKTGQLSEFLLLVASRIGRDVQQEAQLDATGGEDRALEQAPAALEL